jgi:hypothetical protein
MRVILSAGIVVAASFSAFSQAPPTGTLSFEVASVRPSAPGARPDPSREGTFDAESATRSSFRSSALLTA